MWVFFLSFKTQYVTIFYIYSLNIEILMKFMVTKWLQDWTLATTLMRETRLFTDQELSRDLVLTREKYGSVKRVFIIAEKDLILEKDFQQWMIQKNPPNEVKEILGSDHMSMMSKPKELWACLQRISKKYN